MRWHGGSTFEPSLPLSRGVARCQQEASARIHDAAIGLVQNTGGADHLDHRGRFYGLAGLQCFPRKYLKIPEPIGRDIVGSPNPRRLAGRSPGLL